MRQAWSVSIGSSRDPSRSKWPWRSSSVVFLLFGVLWLLVSINHLIAGPRDWPYYGMLLIGVIAFMVAIHPMSRTTLSWPTTQLEDDESLVLQTRGSLVDRISRGGTVTLTNRRLIFDPNSIELTLKMVRRVWGSSDIVEVDVAPRGPNLLGGAVRRRLRLRLTDGTAALFVVKNPEALRQQMDELCAPDAPSARRVLGGHQHTEPGQVGEAPVAERRSGRTQRSLSCGSTADLRSSVARLLA